MVGTMPYSIEKGPYLAVLEDHVNQSAANLRQVLTDLRDGRSIPEIGGFNSKTIANPVPMDALIEHTNKDWFGFTKDAATGKWKPQEPWSLSNPQTGFWQDWYGDCEEVLRRTLIRGFEVALGIGPEDPVPTGSGGQRWPIEAYWRCPIPWFEGWVTWRQKDGVAKPGPRDGQVTILISTPGHGHPLRNTPVRDQDPPPAGYVLNPTGTPGPRGMNVISQKYHKPWPKMTTVSSSEGSWTFPTQGLGYISEGEVVCVAPPEAEGGLLDPPRKWEKNDGVFRRAPMSPSKQP